MGCGCVSISLLVPFKCVLSSLGYSLHVFLFQIDDTISHYQEN